MALGINWIGVVGPNEQDEQNNIQTRPNQSAPRSTVRSIPEDRAALAEAFRKTKEETKGSETIWPLN